MVTPAPISMRLDEAAMCRKAGSVERTIVSISGVGFVDLAHHQRAAGEKAGAALLRQRVRRVGETGECFHRDGHALPSVAEVPVRCARTAANPAS